MENWLYNSTIVPVPQYHSTNYCGTVPNIQINRKSFLPTYLSLDSTPPQRLEFYTRVLVSWYLIEGGQEYGPGRGHLSRRTSLAQEALITLKLIVRRLKNARSCHCPLLWNSTILGKKQRIFSLWHVLNPNSFFDRFLGSTTQRKHFSTNTP